MNMAQLLQAWDQPTFLTGNSPRTHFPYSVSESDESLCARLKMASHSGHHLGATCKLMVCVLFVKQRSHAAQRGRLPGWAVTRM